MAAYAPLVLRLFIGTFPVYMWAAGAWHTVRPLMMPFSGPCTTVRPRQGATGGRRP